MVVADAHFGSAPAADEEAFLALLDAAPSMGDALLLAGDLYDFWFSYRRLIPRHAARITAGIIHLARRHPVLMLGGNHDRWGEGFWEGECGIRFDPWRLGFEVGSRRVLGVHGDGLHAERPSAAFLSRLLASRAVITAFRFVPAAIGFKVADRLGHDPAYAAAHPEFVDEGAARQLAWATQTLEADPGLSAVIMGHTHRQVAAELFPGRWYLNPGAWLDGHAYGILDDAGARVARFS